MSDRSYADCFRILRDAVKDGIIRDWCYGSYMPTVGADMPDDSPGIDVYPGEGRGHGFESFRDPDGTKGDIGLLREAADYVRGLQCKNVLAQFDMTPLARGKLAVVGDELEYKFTLRPGDCAHIVNSADTARLQVFTRRILAEKKVDSD